MRTLGIGYAAHFLAMQEAFQSLDKREPVMKIEIKDDVVKLDARACDFIQAKKEPKTYKPNGAREKARRIRQASQSGQSNE